MTGGPSTSPAVQTTRESGKQKLHGLTYLIQTIFLTYFVTLNICIPYTFGR